jgi:hypothetical protein
VHAKLAAAIAHHHGAIPCETTAIDAAQPERSQPRKELGRISGRGIERECELVVWPRQQPA